MTNTDQAIELINNLNLPEQTLPKLSCNNSGKLNKFSKWNDGLKTTQAISTCIMLYKVLPEIAKLNTSYKTRQDMLEIARTRLHTVSQGLAKAYLKQPIILPTEAQKAAIIAQAIQKHLLDGYLVCLKQYLLQKKLPKTATKDIALLVCRAMHAIQTLFFRSYQLYTKYPHNLWLTLHSLYLIAKQFDALEHPIDDVFLQYRSSMNAEHTYARTLLLSASKPNQLSQLDITALYEVLEQWCIQTNIIESITASTPLSINLYNDHGPFHKNAKKTESHVNIDMLSLVKHLRQIASEQDNQTIQKASKTSRFIINHTLNAWTEPAKRLDKRNPANNEADVCIGLLDCHQLLAQGENFQNFIENDTAVETRSQENYTPNMQFEQALPDNINVSCCTVINVSQQGFCLLWKGEIPSKIEAGEILLIRERSRNKWKLGAIRWIKQLKDASQLGIQIIAHEPIPAAIRQMTKNGNQVDYQRALLTSSEDENTLLCPANIFSANSNADVIQNGKQQEIKIQQSIYTTSNVAQYAYHASVMSA